MAALGRCLRGPRARPSGASWGLRAELKERLGGTARCPPASSTAGVEGGRRVIQYQKQLQQSYWPCTSGTSAWKTRWPRGKGGEVLRSDLEKG